MTAREAFLGAALLFLSPGSGLALGPDADRSVMAGLEAGYALDFAASSAAFAAADRLAPEHPAGPFFLASLVWLELSLNVDEPGTLERLEPEFDLLMGEAFRRAQALIDKEPRAAEGYFYRGAAYGMRGRWKIVKRQWIRAAADGWNGYRDLETAVRLDPEYYDAYLGLGMYDYYADTMPAILKFASSLIVSGDKKRGLRFVNIAVQHGHFSAMEAQLFLAGIYTTYEKEPDRALEIIRDLRLTRPANLFLLYMEVAARVRAKDWPGAVACAEELSARARQAPEGRPYTALFDLYLADAYLGSGDFAKARDAASRCAADAADARRASVTFCLLRRAQAHDLRRERREALADYSAVQARPPFWSSREHAARGLKRPATYDAVVEELAQ